MCHILAIIPQGFYEKYHHTGQTGATPITMINRLQTGTHGATLWHILDTLGWHHVRPCDTVATSRWSGVQTVATTLIPLYIWDLNLQMRQINTEHMDIFTGVHRGQNGTVGPRLKHGQQSLWKKWIYQVRVNVINLYYKLNTRLYLDVLSIICNNSSHNKSHALMREKQHISSVDNTAWYRFHMAL